MEKKIVPRLLRSALILGSFVTVTMACNGGAFKASSVSDGSMSANGDVGTTPAPAAVDPETGLTIPEPAPAPAPAPSSGGSYFCKDDEAEAPYPVGTAFSSMEDGMDINFVIIQDNAPTGGSVGSEDRQWVAQSGHVYDGAAPGNENSLPVGRDLGTIASFLAGKNAANCQ